MEADFGPGISIKLLVFLLCVGAILIAFACFVMWRYYDIPRQLGKIANKILGKQ
jgi:uncharacterized iron-regulated membrane protein